MHEELKLFLNVDQVIWANPQITSNNEELELGYSAEWSSKL